MRINVYAEELTEEVKIVEKKIEDGRTFFAVRLFLKSANELHFTPTDDDRSAITFWVPWHDGKNHPHELTKVLVALANNALTIQNEADKRGGNPVTL